MRRSRPATRTPTGPSTTDWLQVLTLYDMLLAYDRSPVVRLNRAVALARIEGPAEALVEVDALEDALGRFHLWHAVRAHLLRELGRDDEALAADLRALELTANDAERRLIARGWPAARARVARRRRRATRRAGTSSAASRSTAGRGRRRRQAPTGVRACETSRSRVDMPSRDRIDSRWPCTDA